MTINPQLQGKDQFEVLAGSVTNHFAQIESVLLQNECVNGQYNMVSSACYGQNTPVAAPGFTKVCISVNGSLIADLENSYITADIIYTLKYSLVAGLPGAAGIQANDAAAGTVCGNLDGARGLSKYFIGFKQSLDALERYDIYVNSSLIYSQPFVAQESFVQVAGLKDEILKKNPFVYTSYANAASMDSNVCGVYVDLTGIAPNTPFQITIPVKINLHQFLLLSPIHYLPPFTGKWEIELYFNSRNLIICPVHPKAYLSQKHFQLIAANNDRDIFATYIDAGNGQLQGFSKHFTQINEPLFVIAQLHGALDGATDANYVLERWNRLTLSCDETVLNKCIINLTQFQLRYEVAESLRAHYLEAPLIIPTNILTYQRFSMSNTQDSNLLCVSNLPVENVDSLFILVPHTANQRTCFYQPYLKNLRLSAGEFGIKPAQYVDTFNDARFVGLTLDALNLENSQIASMNCDFANSIMPHVAVFNNTNLNNSDPAGYIFQEMNDNKLLDNSHFLIGFPLSQVGFQSGTMSSPIANINFRLDANTERMVVPIANRGVVQPAAKRSIDAQIIAMFLIDCEIICQPIAGSDIPIVKLSTKSVV